MNFNIPKNISETTNPSTKPTAEQLAAKKRSLVDKFKLGAMGLVAATALTQMDSKALGAEKGVLTPDMQPTVGQVQTQDGSNLEVNPGSFSPSTNNENFKQPYSDGEKSLENYNLLPEEMKPVTGEPMDDIRDTYTPGDPVDIGPAFNGADINK